MKSFFHLVNPQACREAEEDEDVPAPVMTEFRLDDVVKLASGAILRIDRLTYRAPDLGNRRSASVVAGGGDVFPVLVVSGPVFRPMQAEYVCDLGTVVHHLASEVVAKLVVVTATNHIRPVRGKRPSR